MGSRIELRNSAEAVGTSRLIAEGTACTSASLRPLRVEPVEDRLLALSVVIPTYGERGNLEELITRLSANLQSVLDDRFELIVVDDDSPDGTWKLAAEIAETNPHVRVMRRCQERGLATAVVRGWQIARGDVLAVIDGDLQHPPELVEDLWRLVHLDGADLAIASRHAPGGSPGESPFLRKLISQSLRLVGWIALPSIFGRISDPMSGYFALRRSCIEGKELDPKGYKILIEVLGRGKITKIRELGYTFSSRNSGASKATFRVFWEYLVHLAKLSAWRYLRR